MKIKTKLSEYYLFNHWIKYHYNSEDRGQLLSPQEAIEFLEGYLLGTDYYVLHALNCEQTNSQIVFDILMKYSKTFRRKWKRYKRSIK